MLPAILAATARPEPFEPSDAPFWDDPYISTHLLAAHLDDGVEHASRPSATIRATIDRLVDDGLVFPGARVLDLGCGPGRYAELLAAAGAVVTGMDLSRRSLEYARDRAAHLGLDIDYRLQDFRTVDDIDTYDLVLQSYGELSTFSDQVRDDLLGAVRRSLRTGGAFVFDLSTPALRKRVGVPVDWWAEEGGFWRPGPHLVLARGHAYDDDVWCDHYVVVDEQVTEYRMWFHDYTPRTILPVLTRAGFAAELQEGLEGGPYRGGEWIGVVARPST